MARLVETQFNGKFQKVDTASPRAGAIRDGLGDFVAAVSRKCGERVSGAVFDVTVDGLYDRRLGPGFTKDFIAGAFTMGLLGHIEPASVTYTARNSVLVKRADGTTRVFTATSDKMQGQFDRDIPDSIVQTLVALERQADRQCFDRIAERISASGFLNNPDHQNNAVVLGELQFGDSQTVGFAWYHPGRAGRLPRCRAEPRGKYTVALPVAPA